MLPSLQKIAEDYVFQKPIVLHTPEDLEKQAGDMEDALFG